MYTCTTFLKLVRGEDARSPFLIYKVGGGHKFPIHFELFATGNLLPSHQQATQFHMAMEEYDATNLGGVPFINSTYLLTYFVDGPCAQQGEDYKGRRKGRHFKNQPENWG